MKNGKNIAKDISNKLKKLGFIIHRYDARSTNSIYLKIDFGLCCGIRIADHVGRKKYHYRFNVFKDYKGDKIILRDNLISYFYTFEEIPKLIEDIKKEKEEKLKKYGFDSYKKYMENESKSNALFKRFKEVA